MKFTFFIIIILNLGFIYADTLKIEPTETYIEKIDGEDGFHLYIKARDGIGSIMLTDSTKDPEDLRSVFALRDFDENPTVKDEIRILDGTILDSKYNFLISSTPRENDILGSAFYIYIPRGVTYGYPWSREGQIDILEGSWINIRTFALPYGDYSGGFMDNPFIIRTMAVEEEPEPVIKEDIFSEIASETDGYFTEEINGDGAVDVINKILEDYKGKDIDVVLVVDTTISMKDDIEFIRKRLVPLVKEKIETFGKVRVGVVLYRDYKEAYLTKKYDFQTNLDMVQLILDNAKVAGGRDIPEAVFEGIYEAQTNLVWESPNRIIIQIGDAPPHPEPRGDVTPEMVYNKASELGIKIYPILLEDKKDK
jgi:hypothetical protein